MRRIVVRHALLPVALLAALAASPSGAALVKCADERGRVVYQDSACPPGKELRELEADPAERRFIHNGMSEAEVIMRIGRPDVRSKGHGKAGSMRWSYLPAAGDADTLTTLTLAGGKVIDVERRVAR